MTEVPSRPGQPQVVEQTDASVTVTWDAPAWDGGCPLLHYIIERREMRGPRWVRVQKSAVASPPYTAGDLLPASCYQFRVYACNVVGVGEPSQMSKVIACTKTGTNQLVSFSHRRFASFLRATAVPAGTAEARISYGNSVCPSV